MAEDVFICLYLNVLCLIKPQPWQMPVEITRQMRIHKRLN